jgi:ACT domain-containing protein
MFKDIPQTRLIAYLMLLGLLPLVLVAVNFFSKQEQLRALEEKLENVNHMAFVKEKKQALNNAVRQHYRDADHFYIDKYIETIVPLESEIESLQKITTHRNFTEDEAIKKRLDFLTNSNTLIFSEGVVQSYPLFQETTETLVHPVEVNVEDIKKILAKVEGVEIGPYAPGPNPPQLIVTDFRLEKKKVNDGNEVYLLNLKLLKREFL